MKNTDVVSNLKPELLWYHFAKISEIPRGSKNEVEVMNYIKDFAREHQLEFKEDKAGNVVITKSASKGFEQYPGVILQGHTDMVCEKNSDTKHDFEKDPIQLVEDGEYIRANGTTLGADNGIGVCAALAVLEDNTVEHGPIEALFTIDEETGLTGAFNLEAALLKHRIMLNMDSEEDGAIYVGCAGGKDTAGSFELKQVGISGNMIAYRVDVKGLKGGHSGLDINNGLANALRLLARFLKDILNENMLFLTNLQGGSKRNAIPREAFAEFVMKAEKNIDLDEKIKHWNIVFKNEYGDVEPGLQISVQKMETPSSHFTGDLTKKLINTLFMLPHGVITMSQSIKDLVETSTNLATVNMNEDEITIGTSQRSSIASAIEDISLRVQSIFENMGADVNVGDAYPGWKPNMDSGILQIAKQSMTRLSGSEPDVKAIHAGLECGIIGEKFPGMDMVSFGPTIFGAHSPDEKVDIKAVERFWEYLLDMLKTVDNI